MKFKKLVSGLLTAAMLATSIVPSTSVLAEETPDSGSQLTTLARFEFNNNSLTNDGDVIEESIGRAEVKSGCSYEKRGDGDYALTLDGASQWLNITDNRKRSLLAGQDEITISFDLKDAPGGKAWTFFADKNAEAPHYGSETYFAMIGKTVQRFYQGRAEHKNGGYELDATDAFNASGWKHVDVVATDDKTKVYINGEEVSSADNTVKLTTALGESPVLQFGKANWGSGEFGSVTIDNLAVYAGAGIPEEDFQKSMFSIKGGNIPAVISCPVGKGVTYQITAPEGEEITDLTYTVGAPTVAKVDDKGVITGVSEGITTITGSFKYNGVEIPFTADVNVVDMGRILETKGFQYPLAVKVTRGNAKKIVVRTPSEFDLLEKKVTFTSSDDKIATVDEDGVVKGEAEGSAAITIKVALTDNGTEYASKTETCAVTVVKGEGEVVPVATVDFAGFTAQDDKFVKDSMELVKEATGEGVAPELVEDADRGQVLSVTQNAYENRGDVVMNNPLHGASADKGFTVSFYAKPTGNLNGGNCMIDFEVAPATTGRAGTLAINQSMIYWNTTDQNGNYVDFIAPLVDKDKWTKVDIVFTSDGITAYKNNKQIGVSVKGGSTTDYLTMLNDMAGNNYGEGTSKVRFGGSLATYWACAGTLLDDVSFYNRALTEAEICGTVEEALPIESVSLTLANHMDVGTSQKLNVKVVPNKAADTIEFVSSNDNVAKITGDVIEAVAEGSAVVYAVVNGVKSNEVTVNVHAPITQLEAGKKYLAVYTTTTNNYAKANTATGARIDQEACSVYFAVSEDGKNFKVLNNGGGVVFAKSGSFKVGTPKIYKQDGKYIIVAPDSNVAKGIHVFTSDDCVAFRDDTLVSTTDFGSGALVKDGFYFEKKGKNLLATDPNVSLGNVIELTDAEYKHIVDKLDTVVNTGLETLKTIEVSSVNDIEKKLAKEVNATYSDGSTQSFKIDWTSALAKAKKDITKSGTYTLTGDVIQTKYLNNLKEINGSTLPEDDPENINPEVPTGCDGENVYYDSTKFVESIADPFIYWDEQNGYYYMTGSYFPETGGKIDDDDKVEQYDRVVLRRGRTLEELQSEENEVTIWKVGNQGFTDANGNYVAKGSRYIWAPEIHRVGDKWVVYFTEAHNGVFNIYCHALVLDGDIDPYETALTYSSQESEWKDYQMCAAEGVTENPFTTAFCLDMTYFKDAVNGKSYVVWAGKPDLAIDNSNSTSLYIATLNEDKPWEITSDKTGITWSDYGWERISYTVNEGATILQKDGNIFLCYSAAGTGSEYAIGMLSAKAGDDLTKYESWTKNPYPLLASKDVYGEEGPGHNSFTVDQDGNAIFVYHARPTSHNYGMCGWDGEKSTMKANDPLNDPCRHARLKRVHWAADGTPILRMTYEDELKEEYQKVNVKVVYKPTVAVTKVSLNKTKLTLGVKESYTLKATVSPSNASNKKVTYKSSNSSIASVDSKGKITAKKAGKVTITATSGTKKATCTVTVLKAPTKLSVSKKSVTVKAKKSTYVTVKPEKNSYCGTYVVKSSNTKVAKASASGSKVKITGVKKGKASITIYPKNGSSKAKVTVKVTVK